LATKTSRSRKRGTTKKKAQPRRPNVLVLAALAALIIGFLFRRMMLPSAVHYLAHRPPEHHVVQPSEDSANDKTGRNVPSEHLSAGDKQQLNTILRRKNN
jgi:hypothetical protein